MSLTLLLVVCWGHVLFHRSGSLTVQSHDTGSDVAGIAAVWYIEFLSLVCSSQRFSLRRWAGAPQSPSAGWSMTWQSLHTQGRPTTWCSRSLHSTNWRWVFLTLYWQMLFQAAFLFNSKKTPWIVSWLSSDWCKLGWFSSAMRSVQLV